MSVCAVVGGQFGSEGKGAIIAHIAKEYDNHVRVGAANAGHTLYSNVNHKPARHVMQQLPCAAYAHLNADLYIGPGALITPDILGGELAKLKEWRDFIGYPMPVIRIDHRAHVITRDHVRREQATDLAARIGSTSTIAKEGIGVAQAARIMREAECVQVGDNWGMPEGTHISDVPASLALEDSILLEGTQGYGLSNTTGYFPYVTSRNTTAAGLCADCGVAPNRLDRVILVVRSYPIRVAGNSGPFAPGSHEKSWEELGVNPENERTTVTKKIRRVASFSIEQIVEAAYVNGATEIALTFADYLDPEIKSRSKVWLSETDPEWDQYPNTKALIEKIEAVVGVPVRMVGTGPRNIIERG